MASNNSVRLVISYVQEEDTTRCYWRTRRGGNPYFVYRVELRESFVDVEIPDAHCPKYCCTGSLKKCIQSPFPPSHKQPILVRSTPSFCLTPSRDETNHHESPHRDRLPPHRLIDGGKWIRPRRCEGSRELRGMAKLGGTAKVATSSRQRKITFDKC